MLETIVSTKVAVRIRRECGDVFCGALEALVVRLRGRGFSAHTMRNYLSLAADFGRWLRRKRTAIGTVAERHTRSFLSKHDGSPRRRAGASGLPHLLAVLRERGLARPKDITPPTKIDDVVLAYGRYLRENRGLKDGTILWHVAYSRGFLRHASGDSALDLRRLSPACIRNFVAERAGRYKPSAVKNVAKALRSFLRFIQVRDGIDVAVLVAAVPAIREWKLAGLPKYLGDDELRRVMASFDASTRQGLRDHAMALLMIDLGLRSVEVAELSLDAIDWASGTIQIQPTKSSRGSELPLPARVGRALVAYLREGRPSTTTRRIFVHHRAPVGEPLPAGTVGAAMKRAFKRAGLALPSNGSHALRHTAATRLLRGGASFKEIADIMRHRSIDTTAIYAKVDLVRLRGVALPWPAP